MRITASQLIGMKIGYAVYENELYFDVLGIKEFFPNKKFPPEKIKSLPIGAVYKNTIRAEDVEDMTEFDKNVLKFMRAKK